MSIPYIVARKSHFCIVHSTVVIFLILALDVYTNHRIFMQDEQELAPPPTDSKLTSLRQQQTDSTDGGGPPAGGPQPPGPSVTAPPSVTNAYSRQVCFTLCEQFMENCLLLTSLVRWKVLHDSPSLAM